MLHMRLPPRTLANPLRLFFPFIVAQVRYQSLLQRGHAGAGQTRLEHLHDLLNRCGLRISGLHRLHPGSGHARPPLAQRLLHVHGRRGVPRHVPFTHRWAI